MVLRAVLAREASEAFESEEDAEEGRIRFTILKIRRTLQKVKKFLLTLPRKLAVEKEKFQAAREDFRRGKFHNVFKCLSYNF